MGIKDKFLCVFFLFFHQRFVDFADLFRVAVHPSDVIESQFGICFPKTTIDCIWDVRNKWKFKEILSFVIWNGVFHLAANIIIIHVFLIILHEQIKRSLYEKLGVIIFLYYMCLCQFIKFRFSSKWVFPNTTLILLLIWE